MASSTRPSDTPVRISPTMIRCNVSRSSAVARAASARSRSSRARRAPAPCMAATSPKAVATSGSVSGGAVASCPAAGSQRTPSSRAAAAAAGLLGDEFDVAPLLASTDASALVPAVLLLGADAPAGRWDDRRLRVVALVEGEEPGPWPGYWYALLPAGVSAPILARAVRNAFADIDHVGALTQLEHELFELNEIGIRLSAERNRDALLDTILTRAREITRSDAGPPCL